MKLAITGHTSGLGHALYERFSPAIGFSRSNGYNIAAPDDRARIVSAAADCDVFINNAYAGIAQVDLLYEIYAAWRDTDRLIVNISSNSGDGIKTRPHIYAVHKTALDKASQQLSYQKSSVRICNLRFGWLDTPRVSAVNEAKISLVDAGDMIDTIIKQSTSGMITDLTMLPKT